MSIAAVKDYEVTIPTGESASNALSLIDGHRLFGVLLQADFTDANLAPQFSIDDGASWHFISKKGEHVKITGVADEVCLVDNPVDLAVFPSYRFLSVSKTDNTTPVNQTTAQKIELICRAI